LSGKGESPQTALISYNRTSELISPLLLNIHTGEIFNLQAIYPILNGLGMIGLLVTGLSMSGVFGRK
jgi:hypothetical protein